MRMAKRIAVSLLAAAMALSMLTACGGGNPEQPADSNNGNSGTTEPAKPEPTPNPTPTPDPTPSEPAKPALPTTWADSRTNAYFTRLGVTRENFYAEMEISVGTYSQSGVCAAKGKKLTTGYLDENGSYNIGEYIDEVGNVYRFSTRNGERTVSKCEAGSEAATNSIQEIKQEVYCYLMIPEANEIASMTVSDYQGYYMESFHINSAEAGTGTYEYVFDGDELKFILWGGQYKITFQTLYPNPSDEQVSLPSWYSENIEKSKTSQYFKAKGITENNLYLDMELMNYYAGHHISTVKGKEATLIEMHIGSKQIESGYYISQAEDVCSFSDHLNGYIKIDKEGSEAKWAKQGVRTSGGYFMIPSSANSYWYGSGTYEENGKEYYKESFQTGTENRSDDIYTYVFDGNELMYIIHQGATCKINKISGTPDESLLKILDRYTEYDPNN